jgi:hypothetical protein
MTDTSEPRGRITEHGRGAAAPSPKAVEERARELALINHPDAPEVRDEDRAQARGELHGAEHPTTADDAECWRVADRNPRNPTGLLGRQAPEVSAPSPQQELERTAQQGVDEAEHERMLRARLEQKRREEAP